MSLDNTVDKPSDKSVNESSEEATLASALVEAFSKLAVRFESGKCVNCQIY